MVNQIQSIVSGYTADIREIKSRPASKQFHTSYIVTLGQSISDTELLEVYTLLRELQSDITLEVPNV